LGGLRSGFFFASLRWTTRDRRRAELIKMVLFDYKYAMLGVRIIEFCWLLNLRKREATTVILTPQ
jgi:hypothetical protein